METIKLLEEIRNDYVNKFDNDPLIKRVCDVMISEYKARSKAFSLKDVVNLCCENSQKHNDLLKDEFKDTVCKCGNKMV